MEDSIDYLKRLTSEGGAVSTQTLSLATEILYTNHDQNILQCLTCLKPWLNRYMCGFARLKIT